MNFKVLFFVLVIIFSLGAATFGVFYFMKNKAYNELEAENDSLRGRTTTQTDETAETTTEAADKDAISELNAQIKTLTGEKNAAEKAKTNAEAAKTAAETAKATAENSLALEKSNEAIAQKYNEVLAYFVGVVDTHGGLAGITDAEYDTAKTLAEETGDNELINKLDYVWDQIAVPQIDRIVSLLDYIQSKIELKLQ